MIHHFSISVQHTEETAQNLAALFDGKLTSFGPHADSYMVWFGDEYGSAIELYPIGTELSPGENDDHAQFNINPHNSVYIGTHVAISIKRDKKYILDFAKNLEWRAIELSRGSFNVIELWVENRIMLELLTEEMAQDYLNLAKKFRDDI